MRITEKGEHVISSIHAPSITPYLPAADKANGAAIIIAPGGGHRELWIDHEGYNPARWFMERGVAAFVLKYRLAREPNSTYTIDEHALMDIQRAIRYVRSRAREWKIDPHKIGVMGFSAGGEVAALSAMRFDNGNGTASDTIERQPCRPDFQALIYPGNSARFEVTKDSPPIFIVCGYNDRDDIPLVWHNYLRNIKRPAFPRSCTSMANLDTALDCARIIMARFPAGLRDLPSGWGILIFYKEGINPRCQKDVVWYINSSLSRLSNRTE